MSAENYPPNYPLAPAHLWRHFYQITQIPRPSGREAAVRQYMIGQAEQGGHQWQTDREGNLLIRVAASSAMSDRQTVVIQNHLDMVTVKTADKAHDFAADPLSLHIDGDWLQADRTTLGADNGVGCAAALALMTDPAVVHPPLELLFTVDEETGLGGALNLDAGMLTGQRMLNLDTEDWNELYVGCAGGGGWEMRRQFATAPLPAGDEVWALTLSGLAGGHSGVQIHEQLGNAIKLLALSLSAVPGLQLAEFDAGVAHNVIPREGRVRFACPAGMREDIGQRLEQVRADVLSYLPDADAALNFDLEPASTDRVLDTEDSRLLLDLVAAMPHGVQAGNLQLPGELVDLSINLAVLRLRGGELYLESSFRFFNEVQSEPLQQTVMALARVFALDVSPVVGYPGWQPDFDSDLLAQGKRLHQRLFGIAPAVKAIHAGLECGILKGKKPDLDILSFGPTIRGAHSPSERLQISTVAPFWQLLTTLLREL